MTIQWLQSSSFVYNTLGQTKNCNLHILNLEIHSISAQLDPVMLGFENFNQFCSMIEEILVDKLKLVLPHPTKCQTGRKNLVYIIIFGHRLSMTLSKVQQLVNLYTKTNLINNTRHYLTGSHVSSFVF